MQTVLPALGAGRKKKWSYSSIVFSLFYFVPPIFTEAPINWLLVCLLYVAFVCLYLVSIHINPTKVWVVLMGIVALASVSMTLSPGAIVLFGFVSFIVSYYYPPKASILAGVSISLLLWWIQHEAYPEQLFLLFAGIANLIVLLVFGVMERQETLQNLKDAEHQSVLQKLSAVAERERIGRDLHDVAGHALSSISLKAQLAVKLLEREQLDKAKTEVAELAELSQSLLAEIRQTVSGIKHLGLSEELEKSASILRTKGFDVDIVYGETVDNSLTAIQETQCSLIVKELFTNILKHSNGNKVRASIQQHGNRMEISVQDNGELSSISDGNGRQGLKERVSALSGEIHTRIENGLMIHIQFPLEGREHVQIKEQLT